MEVQNVMFFSVFLWLNSLNLKPVEAQGTMGLGKYQIQHRIKMKQYKIIFLNHTQ
jgi:hypothetical protein